MRGSCNDAALQRPIQPYPDVQEARYMIHHVFLPPQLPQQDDFAPKLDDALVKLVVNSLQEFHRLQDNLGTIDTIISMARTFRTIHNEYGHIAQARLEETLAKLSEDEHKVVLLHVRAQNAGIIIYRNSNGAIFEVFELSPNNISVVSTKGRLLRSFPAFSVSVPLENLGEDEFRATISQTVSQMSAERVEEMQPKVKKAGEMQSEIRDTTIPHLVTEHLINFLRAIGKPFCTTTVNKNTREEVLWKGAKSPWRRSPLWLLFRVAMQLTFSRLSADPAKSLYKPFMAFFMSRVLKLALNQSSLESDIIYAMNAKLSQRLLKAGGRKEDLWLSQVWDIMKKALSHVSSCWNSVMAHSCPSIDLLALRALNPSEDIIHELPLLDQFLHQLQGLSKPKTHGQFQPRGKFPLFDSDHLPRFAHFDLDSLHRSFRLAALESWVELHLETWLDRHINLDRSCVELSDLIKCYHQEAKIAYEGNPEALSIMVLTIMDLWVACDKTACWLYESLKLYNHEIAPFLLSSLLLPLKSQLSRISNVEAYFKSRANAINKSFVSPFRNFAHENSFAVRYFDQSPRHHQLLAEIQEKAEKERKEKVQQLARLNQSYRDLMDRYESCCCEYVEVTRYDVNESPYQESQHNSFCMKCSYLAQANRISISLHEWPISRDPNTAKATIFELAVPLDFGAWRDITLYMIRNVLGYEYRKQNATNSDYTLQLDPGIGSFSRMNLGRIGIKSHTKPSTVTHRNPVSIPTTEASVCLTNGLSYQYFDFETGCLIDSFVTTHKLHAQCVFALTTRSTPLQKFLQRTPDKPNGPEPNEVIASLSECPDGMSIHEFTSFALVPLCYKIQWQNVLCQLAIPALDFTKVDTTFLLLQVSQQIGPNKNSICRASHQVLSDERFSTSLLEQLREAMQRVGENWESFHAPAGFICLAARLLASSPFPRIRSNCLEYLASCRYLLFGWVTKLRAKTQGCIDSTQRDEFAARTVEIALTCISSFGVDREHLKSILCRELDASIFLQCSIAIQEHLSSIHLSRSSFASIFLTRWRRLMYEVYHELVHQIVELPNFCLNLAIKEFWADYKAGFTWQQLSPPNQHWLYSSTTSDGGIDSFSVHFNLLTAELLVNGAPLAKLPAEYENNAMYPTLFGRSHLQVMPSSQPGYSFSSRCEYDGYLVHFGMLGDDMLIYAVRGDCIYSLIPPRVLSGHLPQAFVHHYVHWFDHQLQVVFCAPIENPWSQSPRYWRFASEGSGWIITKGNENLINIRSRTAQTIGGILDPLENILFVHISYHTDSGTVEIELPRLHLGFFHNPGNETIMSHQFQDMYIDGNQNFGTLFGLASKLVLKAMNGSRRLLIPEGEISFQRLSGHVSVSIQKRVSKVHSYSIDNQLGRLVGSGSMQSMLLLCYLHSLTSYCLPDPLTKITGTEQALTIITSAAVRSFDILNRDHLQILGLIAQLAPKRHFYPSYLQEMQTVYWDRNLSFLSQHSQLYLEVRDIFSQAMQFKPLYPGFTDPPSLEWTELHLLERDLIRSSTVRVSGFGAENFTNKHDIRYKHRDGGQKSIRAQRTFTVAHSIFKKEPVLHNQSLTCMGGHLWKQLSVQNRILGPRNKLMETETLYGGHLLGNTAEYLASKWCQGHVSLSHDCTVNKYRLMMWLSTIAFAKEADMLLVGTFVAFYCIPSMAGIAPPNKSAFSVKEGSKIHDLQASIKFQPIEACPESRLAPLIEERAASTRERRRQIHVKKQEMSKASFINMLKSQWPCEYPTTPHGEEVDVYIEIEPTMASIMTRWGMWWKNLELRNYLTDIEGALREQSYQMLDTSLIGLTYSETHSRTRKRHICNQDLFEQPPPLTPSRSIDNLAWLVQKISEQEHTNAPIERLLATLKLRVSAHHEQQYLSELQESIAHLNSNSQIPKLACPDLETIDKLLQLHRNDCEQTISGLFDSLVEVSNQRFPVATSILHAPRISQRLYLAQLSHTRWQSLSHEWKAYLVRYAKAFRTLQRAERLIRASTNRVELISELVNVDNQEWDPMTFPDWLLLEVESGLLLREVQASIAKHMLNPELGRNSVMQLNMGEGKSTFIAPAVAAALANGQNLVRLFVSRPQSKQMFQMLVSKLGDLLGRRVYHMPVSRSLRLQVSEAESLWAMFNECMKRGGILLIQPEHVLSFKLMALESLNNGDDLLGQSLLKSQHFFETHSRDIIDESDENFSVKFELVYTMGLQQPIELSPDRWILIQHILGLVARFAPVIAIALGTQAIELENRRGCFPRTRILQTEAGRRLRMEIAKHICTSGIVGFPVTHQSAEMRRAIQYYITEPILRPDEISRIENSSSTAWNDSLKSPLLLIRGLLACGILDFVFSSKRWRVDYGIDPLRLPPTKLAVPFLAKDCPSPRSEFSHPDVLIMLTCLSYYYEGISDEDLFDSFRLLLRADQADVEYRVWVESATDLPEAFRHLSSINIKDRLQCTGEVFPALRFSKGAIDYFLSHIVFQKYIKEFPHKISASGWDLGQQKLKPTTGFSGTIDSRHLLPLDVYHLDLDRQKHTNALVLKHILQPENSVQLLLSSSSSSSHDSSQTSNADMLLQTIKSMQPVVRVILDVGAQILEFNNQQVVERWLSMEEDRQKTEAAVFFNENNEISVLDRKGKVELLQVSPYANRLHVCLVFLDEAHTRGTDLRLPEKYCAAVTLGPCLTKDRLVQACMRMRKLGKGQSLVFCIPGEIQAKILQLKEVTEPSSIEVLDVLAWSISETFHDHRRSMPLWAMQGHRFITQQKFWEAARRDDCLALSKDMAEQFLEDESQSLDHRYRPRINGSELSDWEVHDERVDRIRERCREFDISSSEATALEEEQERELLPEIEEEREVERPACAKALKHSVHNDMRYLVTTGNMKNDSKAWLPAFQSLHNTTAVDWLGETQFPSDLLVTADFSRTVQPAGRIYNSDNFLRPVQWILTCNDDKVGMKLIVISPYEADELLSSIRTYKKVTLHCYLPRPSLQFRALESLNLFNEGGYFESSTVPKHLRIQLNLFAGQLYLRTFEDYTATCDFLGLAWQPQEHGVEVASDGFIVNGRPSNFTKSPVKFLHVLLTRIRRDCDSIEKTHMGKILSGTLLERGEFTP